MATGTHAVVWIDHQEAKIVYVNRDGTEEMVVHPEHARHHLRSKAGSHESYRATADHVFYQRVANDLTDVRGFLVVGPAQAKTEFIKHLHRYDPRLFPRLTGVESMDHPTDGELNAMARQYFRRADGLIQRPSTI